MKTILKWSVAILFLMAYFGCTKTNKDIEDKILPETLDCDALSSDRTLKNDPNKPVDYILTCGVIGVTGRITIEPGTVIQVEDGGGFAIVGNGSLSALGSASNPIVFTAVSKQTGSWRGIYFETNNVNNALEHCKIEYAGGQAFNSNDNKGAIVIWANARVRIENCEITKSEHAGINMVYNNSIVKLANNSFSDTKGTPIHTLIDNVHSIESTNTFSNNRDAYVLCESGSFTPGQSLKKLSIPYRFRRSSFHHGATVEGGLFTVEKGVVVEMDNTAYIYIRDSGSLRISGTQSEPVIFQGVDKVAGSWAGFYISFSNSVNNVFDYLVLQHAGDRSEWGKGAITMWANPRLRIQNSTFRDIDACGIYNYSGATNPNLSLENNTYINVSNNDFCGEQ